MREKLTTTVTPNPSDLNQYQRNCSHISFYKSKKNSIFSRKKEYLKPCTKLNIISRDTNKKTKTSKKGIAPSWLKKFFITWKLAFTLNSLTCVKLFSEMKHLIVQLNQNCIEVFCCLRARDWTWKIPYCRRATAFQKCYELSKMRILPQSHFRVSFFELEAI